MQSENWKHWGYQLRAAADDYKHLSYKKWIASITLADNEFPSNDYIIICYAPFHGESQKYHEQMEWGMKGGLWGN